MLFQTLNILGHGCGKNTIVAILTGQKSKLKARMTKIQTFASLKDMNTPKNREILSEYIRILHHDGYFTEKKIPNISGTYLELNILSSKWLNNNSYKQNV